MFRFAGEKCACFMGFADKSGAKMLAILGVI